VLALTDTKNLIKKIRLKTNPQFCFFFVLLQDISLFSFQFSFSLTYLKKIYKQNLFFMILFLIRIEREEKNLKAHSVKSIQPNFSILSCVNRQQQQ
jgi:hypothetical protein